MGAGVSSSILPDFRSPQTGLFERIAVDSNPLFANLPHPYAIFDINYFKQNPQPFYECITKYFNPTILHSVQPTYTHKVLKYMCDKDIVRRIYTQNCDNLEFKVGISKEKVIQVHGSFETSSCINSNCYNHIHSKDGKKCIDTILEGKPPLCELCGGLVKPDIVFFNEAIPHHCQRMFPEDLAACDLLIILGSSLKVAPFNTFPSLIEAGTPRLVINREPLPILEEQNRAYDEIPSLYDVNTYKNNLAKGGGGRRDGGSGGEGWQGNDEGGEDEEGDDDGEGDEEGDSYREGNEENKEKPSSLSARDVFLQMDCDEGMEKLIAITHWKI